MSCRAPCHLRLCLLVALVGACGQERDLPDDTVLTSPHFRYHVRAGDPVCENVLDGFEAHHRGVHQALGLLRTRRTIDYYKYRDREDFEQHSPCPPGAIGCARGSEAHARAPAIGHELVHLYLWPHDGGGSHALLGEGIAEIFDCEETPPRRRPAISFDEALALGDRYPAVTGVEAAVFLEAAARFSHFLYGRLGGPALVSLVTRSGGSAAHVRALVAAALGAGTDVDAAWESAMGSDQASSRSDICPCGGPPLPLAAEAGAGEKAASTRVGGACATPLAHHTIVLEEEASVAVQVTPQAEGGERFSYTLRSCEGDREAPGLVASGEGGAQTLVTRLAPGRYFLAPVEGVADVRVARGSWWSPSCSADAAPYRPSAEEAVTLALPASQAPVYLTLETAEPRALSIPDADRAQLCTSCGIDGAASCAPHGPGEPIQGRRLLRFGAGAAVGQARLDRGKR